MTNSPRVLRLRRSGGHEYSPSPLRPSPMGTKIPLNDDVAEKAKRFKKRSLLRGLQANEIAAAASPARRQTIGSVDDPTTPRNPSALRGGVAGEGPIDVVTPMRKVPILANFEEWMKLATDNKINATNSWNFALIDYFYDMSLLKEGEGINFQKASCTLDGCVKIYTNRVDSVATETGKLLSGLADSNSKRKDRDGEEGEGSDDEAGEDGEDGEGSKRRKRKTQRSSEATLAKDFTSLQIKKHDLELNVDPLFKKATADFDEGGAKGLLLNNLSIDSSGRIVFDSSDDSGHVDPIDKEDDGIKKEDADEEPKEPEPVEEDKVEIDFNALRNKFFPNLNVLDQQDICPSLKNFDLGDPAGSLDIPFLKALEERGDDGDILASDIEGPDGPIGDGDLTERLDMAFGFDAGFGINDDDDGDMGFGEGGEIWANETIVDAAQRFMSPARRPILGLGGEGDEDEDTKEFIVGFGGGGGEDILSYFDETLKKNWAGPEHWRIRKLKDNSKPVNAPARPRKEKETFLIDFMNPEAEVTDDVVRPKKGTASINMPKKDWKSKSRNLLPDDKHFNSTQLKKLFLKPKAMLYATKSSKTTSGGGKPAEDRPEDMDEEFWAREDMAKNIQASSSVSPSFPLFPSNKANIPPSPRPQGLGIPGPADDDDDFADAREVFSPPPDTLPSGTQNPTALDPSPLNALLAGASGATQGVEFGNQLVTSSRRVRPEYVQYAKIAKKVDVRKLKEKLWEGLSFSDVKKKEEPPQLDVAAVKDEGEMKDIEPVVEEERKFTQVMNGLQEVYPQKAMADISTSYCFICLLHLANEKGLVIEGNEALSELRIWRDVTAEGMDEY
ncbi:barren [Choiromyces venosus 120613-1]|uniref:Condensin complex subunit 2 n=1 Tax=Choiromyces venosus 120613-1 TaxID=1336337 RepID=A0A3N4JIL8_9PEZI|nr:barren [Choiromyces venosus 120613-1]